MDDKRFDHLAKLIGIGTSRRTILRALLGLGGAAVAGGVAAEKVDARTVGTRPTIPPPQPPACQLPKQMCGGVCCGAGKCKFDTNGAGHCCASTTDVWCGNACCLGGVCAGTDCCTAAEDPCGTICCPRQPADPDSGQTSTCAISGNTDICCNPRNQFPCGLDCCDYEFQCCDEECCMDGTVCLVRVFGDESVLIEEEECCPIELTCDGRCCDGECFDPEAGSVGDAQLTGLNPDQTCCPATGTVCEGTEGTLCCDGETPQCCNDRAGGAAVCLPADACCTDADCDGCSVCEQEENLCNSICVFGPCCDQDQDPVSWFCPGQGQCCPDLSGCTDDQTCCPFDGGIFVCLDGDDCEITSCLSDEDCDPCRTCDAICIDRCTSPLDCCQINDEFVSCIDLDAEGACCTADTCPSDFENCLAGACIDFQCDQLSTCEDCEVCAEDGCSSTCAPEIDPICRFCNVDTQSCGPAPNGFGCGDGLLCCFGSCIVTAACPDSCISDDDCGVCETCRIDGACVDDCVGEEICSLGQCVDLNVSGSCCPGVQDCPEEVDPETCRALFCSFETLTCTLETYCDPCSECAVDGSGNCISNCPPEVEPICSNCNVDTGICGPIGDGFSCGSGVVCCEGRCIAATTCEPLPTATTQPPATLCLTDNDCAGQGIPACPFCLNGQCAVDQCCASECTNPCAICNRATGDCDPNPALCPDPCEVCQNISEAPTCVDVPNNPPISCGEDLICINGICAPDIG